ncbi:MAG: hypothetical protein QOH67_2926 [Hyphomicrobiales bacterium]|jgi:hypothetical protein|nr:hypothetical protein [Hyphomicrobiales bacterium]
MPATTRQPNFALLLGLAWLLAAFQLLAQNWTETALALADTDDAMRLAQLRDWLGGQGWYDLHQGRVAGGYESHWSRLIDAGLAGTLWVVGWVAEPAMAERLMRTAWPMLWLLPVIAGAAAIAWRIAGREAAIVALLMAVIGLPAFHQFRPGRIDHHNVQIALSVLAVAATVWSDRVRWAAVAAGAVTGLAMAIGLECLPYLLVCAAAFAARYMSDARGAQGAADYGLALAVSSLAGFFVIIGPDHWTRGVCDEIAVNWIALTVVGGMGLALAARFTSERMSVRGARVFLIGAVATALFVAIEPRCLRGPFAMVDPAVWPIWLAHVREMKPLIPLMIESPLIGIAIATFPAAALVAVFVLARSRDYRADFGFLVATAAFMTSAVMTLAAIKSASYATWLAMPLVACFALRLFRLLRLESLVPRAAVGVLLTPAVLSLGAVTIANAAGIGREDHFHRTETPACFQNHSYAALAQLPAGVVATDVNYGPFVLALTPHAVLTAPYHRLSTAIVAAHRAFAAPPEQARGMLAALQADYVAVCGAQAPDGLSPVEHDASLWGRLQAGAVPGWLQPLPLPGPFAVYRIKP